VTKGQEKELQIYNYVRSCLEKGDCPPTVREICAEVGLASPSSVFTYLKSLDKQGKIIFQKGKKRAISLPDIQNVATSYVPLVGRVTAGMPILAYEENLGRIPFSSDKKYSGELFALNVKGDSMVNAAILDGDIVIVEKTSVCRNGEIVVALIEDEATVKRFYKEDGHFRLQPENDAYAPIIVDELSILGRVVSVIRYY